MRYTTIDQASEQARNSDLDAYLSQFDGPDPAPTLLSDQIRAIDPGTLRMDGGDMLLYDMPITSTRLRELLADAQEQLEAYPGERSGYYYSCAAHITEALLASLAKNVDR